MKKTIFSIMFAMTFAMVLGSCGNSTKGGDAVDSLAVDSVQVDTVCVDSVAADTVCAL